MKIDGELLSRISSDLGLDVPYVKGQTVKIKNCWHFSTDGNAVDAMFCDEDDFKDGMNRIFVVVQSYNVVILAFSLMDTHIHFILYGEFEQCNRFMHEYVRRLSKNYSLRHGESHKFKRLPISHQAVETDRYLKTVICYTLKNAPVAGIRFTSYNYPWSSGPLYFQKAGYWCSPGFLGGKDVAMLFDLPLKQRLDLLKTRQEDLPDVRLIDGIVHPGEYVAYEVVEKLFKTCRSFNYFMCTSKEDMVDSMGGSISHLSIPMQEMRQHKNELCMELFGVQSIKCLDSVHRVRLARALRQRYNSSVKQIARLCGLVYDEVKDII